MTVFNVNDHRSNENDTKIDVVFEVDCSDCSSFGLPQGTESWTTWIPDTTVYSAMMRAGSFKGRVTMHLYDMDMVKEYHNQLTHLHPQLVPDQYNPSDALKRNLVTSY